MVRAEGIEPPLHCLRARSLAKDYPELFSTVIFHDDTVKHLKCLDCMYNKNQVLLIGGNEWSRTTFCCVIKTTTSDNHSHLSCAIIFNDDIAKHLKCP